ncbi:MAG: VacJ family lipoprotein [Halofilum sp. (in: g-proteobacteria)]|nr:VacJ family lipoprotein [Halofilum sp. (in: g-proteobacteria)]
MPASLCRLLLPALVASGLAGCAGTPERGSGVYDPLEPVNRRIHAFNDGFDRVIARPVARAYDEVVPGTIDRGVTNFFNNLDDVGVLINSILQLKPRKSMLTTHRLIFNTTLGLFGLIDVVGMMGGEKANEDFGQTLGYWGVGRGPYLVLPLLGPSNLRDGGGRIVDAQYDLVNAIEPDRDRYGAIALRAVDTRAGLLGATDVLDTAAVDPYVFTREAFTRRRARQVHDGNPPPAALPPERGQADDGDFDPFADDDDDLFSDPPAGESQ